jgi:hypothetical protein
VLIFYLLGWQKHENLVAHGKPTIGTRRAAALQGTTGERGEAPASGPLSPTLDPEPAPIPTPVATSTARAPGPGQAPFENGDLEPTLTDLPTADPQGVVDVGDAKSVKA